MTICTSLVCLQLARLKGSGLPVNRCRGHQCEGKSKGCLGEVEAGLITLFLAYPYKKWCSVCRVSIQCSYRKNGMRCFKPACLVDDPVLYKYRCWDHQNFPLRQLNCLRNGCTRQPVPGALVCLRHICGYVDTLTGASCPGVALEDFCELHTCVRCKLNCIKDAKYTICKECYLDVWVEDKLRSYSLDHSPGPYTPTKWVDLGKRKCEVQGCMDLHLPTSLACDFHNCPGCGKRAVLYYGSYLQRLCFICRQTRCAYRSPDGQSCSDVVGEHLVAREWVTKPNYYDEKVGLVKYRDGVLIEMLDKLDAQSHLYCQRHQPQPCYGDDFGCTEIIYAPTQLITYDKVYRLAFACRKHSCKLEGCIFPAICDSKTEDGPTCLRHTPSQCLHNSHMLTLFGPISNRCTEKVVNEKEVPLCTNHRCNALDTASTQRCIGATLRSGKCRTHTNEYTKSLTYSRNVR